jgi:tRNA threonylcarbamoyladenosine biosynthesis protein TsaB
VTALGRRGTGDSPAPRIALGIEAATGGFGYGVALASRSEVLICLRHEAAAVPTGGGGGSGGSSGAEPARASAGLVPLIAEALRAAGVPWDAVDLVAVVDGPGSYTGLRVALATAKGLAMARGLPAVGVDAMEAMAFARGPFVGEAEAAVPAGRGRLYVGTVRWAGERPQLVERPRVMNAAAWRHPEQAERPRLRLDALDGAVGPGVDPVAVARLGLWRAAAGHAVEPERLLPRYASEPRLGAAPRIPGPRG